MTRKRRWLLAGVVAVLTLAAVVEFISYSAFQLRVALVFDKATGRLKDIDWLDLVWLAKPGSGNLLERLIETRNPFAAIESPRHAKSDVETGEHIFRDYCSSCHGNDGTGGPGGPSLHDHVFRRGRTDWALYRTITLGIPGTAMVGRRFDRDDTWRLVAYVKEKVLAPDRPSLPDRSLPQRSRYAPVTADELRDTDSRPGEWLTYSGSYSSQRHSRLNQINRENVKYLRVEWVHQFSTAEYRNESSPIVRGSTIFVTEPADRVEALDASTGRVIWRYLRPPPTHLSLCCGPVNRGVALLGNLVFAGTLDAHLVALDATTGKVVWDAEVAGPSSGYSITGAPLVVGDMVVTGAAGGEFGARGFIDAYDAATGDRRWRFYTVPAAGEPGNETWAAGSLGHGGAPTWLTGSFDPETRLIYWGVGNPSPVYDGEDRRGDNLYSNSVVALEAESGKLRWYFQFTPHDMHDWDSTEIPILVDAVVGNSPRKLLAFANRNGFYYLLDRTTGEFLLGAPFVRQTWAYGLDERGRPRVRPDSIPTREGAIVYPSVIGGTNWWSPSYDPDSQLIFVPTIDRGSIYFSSRERRADELGEVLGGASTLVPNESAVAAVKAIELTTGRVRWEGPATLRDRHPEMGGLLSTAGGLVFGGGVESFVALDAKTGKELWRMRTGGQIVAAPVTFEVGGRQHIAVASGRSLFTFALPRSELQSSASFTPK